MTTDVITEILRTIASKAVNERASEASSSVDAVEISLETPEVSSNGPGSTLDKVSDNADKQDALDEKPGDAKSEGHCKSVNERASEASSSVDAVEISLETPEISSSELDVTTHVNVL